MKYAAIALLVALTAAGQTPLVPCTTTECKIAATKVPDFLTTTSAGSGFSASGSFFSGTVLTVTSESNLTTLLTCSNGAAGAMTECKITEGHTLDEVITEIYRTWMKGDFQLYDEVQDYRSVATRCADSFQTYIASVKRSLRQIQGDLSPAKHKPSRRTP